MPRTHPACFNVGTSLTPPARVMTACNIAPITPRDSGAWLAPINLHRVKSDEQKRVTSDERQRQLLHGKKSHPF